MKRLKRGAQMVEGRLEKAGIPKNLLLFSLSVGVILFSVFLVWVFSFKIPDLSSFDDRKIVNSTKIYDRTGEVLLYNVYQDVKRTDIAFEDMGVHIKNATVAIEDAEFYKHKGVRITSTIRAVLSNVFNVGIGGGGSTITQQLVKNTLLTQRVTVARKIKEWVLAIKIEKALSKEQILEFYLNEAPYGGSNYGIHEASSTYFGKEPVDLTLTEAAYLAAIPQAPSHLSPYGKNIEKLEARKNLVLSRMLDLGFITKEEYKEAKTVVVEWRPQVIGNIAAPHFWAEKVFSGAKVLESEANFSSPRKSTVIIAPGARIQEFLVQSRTYSVIGLIAMLTPLPEQEILRLATFGEAEYWVFPFAKFHVMLIRRP